MWLIDFHTLNQPCIPGINLTWSWCITFLICCWIQIAGIGLRMFVLKFNFKRWLSILFLGEGSGNPHQYSCLENPRDRGAWWAAIYGVVQSRTWLKRLSMHACTGEGNGNPLQCSCLENPRDRGAWWAAIYGVSQSRTWLKRLSSSSSSSRASYLGNRSQTYLMRIPTLPFTCYNGQVDRTLVSSSVQ